LGARPYHPTLGRFLRVDPIEGGAANDYSYTNGDPITQLDLTGRMTYDEVVFWSLLFKNRLDRGLVAAWAEELVDDLFGHGLLDDFVSDAWESVKDRVSISAEICLGACVGVTIGAQGIDIDYGAGLAFGWSLGFDIRAKPGSGVDCREHPDVDYGYKSWAVQVSSNRDSRVTVSVSAGYGFKVAATCHFRVVRW
jgi:hypothetical protein